jgi:hypothetical protein
MTVLVPLVGTCTACIPTYNEDWPFGLSEARSCLKRSLHDLAQQLKDMMYPPPPSVLGTWNILDDLSYTEMD